MRVHFLRIEGEHLLHANWSVQIANDLHCHTTHTNWPLQTAIVTDRAVCNAIQPVRRGASAITKKHATLNPKKDTLKRGELDDQANPTFPQEHGVNKYRGEPYKRWEIEGDGFMRVHFLRIEGEHLLHANWPVQTASGLHCHTAHTNWPLQTAIVTDRAVCNAIQPIKSVHPR